MRIHAIGNDTFDEIVSGLDTIIVVNFLLILSPELHELFIKYKDKVLTHSNANDELSDAIKRASGEVLTSLSKHYRKKLGMFYTDEGLLKFIYSSLHNAAVEKLNQLIDSSPPTTSA